MTARINALTVTLERDLCEDDADGLINAILHLRYVMNVKTHISDFSERELAVEIPPYSEPDWQAEFDAAVETVVRVCLESRKISPPERQAAYLRNTLLTHFDPLMIVAQRLNHST